MAQIEIRLTQDAMIGSPPSPGPLGQPQPNTPARTTISYDALSRPFIRRTTQGSTVETTVFGYSSPSSVPTYLKDSAGKIIWRTFMAAGLLAYADTRGETPKVSFIHPDKRGDDIAETDAAGQLSRKNTYTEYGQIRQGPPPSPYGFLGSYGRFFDPQTSLYLLGARLYDPTLGRFLSRDPIPGGSANDYEYGAGNPIARKDPSGRHTDEECFIANLIFPTDCWSHHFVQTQSGVFAADPDNPYRGGSLRSFRGNSVAMVEFLIMVRRGYIHPRELGRKALPRSIDWGYAGVGGAALGAIPWAGPWIGQDRCYRYGMGSAESCDAGTGIAYFGDIALMGLGLNPKLLIAEGIVLAGADLLGQLAGAGDVGCRTGPLGPGINC
jgi:RHS repeat-associated protein